MYGGGCLALRLLGSAGQLGQCLNEIKNELFDPLTAASLACFIMRHFDLNMWVAIYFVDWGGGGPQGI